MIEEVTPVYIRRAAMDLLARREHSFQELIQKLSRKLAIKNIQAQQSLAENAFQALIYRQVKILADENLQSDDRFIESFINGRKAKGQGPLRIRRDLLQKGLAAQKVDLFLDEQAEQWFELADHVYRKKYTDKNSDNYQEKSRRSRFLIYRGFSSEQVQAVIGNSD